MHRLLQAFKLPEELGDLAERVAHPPALETLSGRVLDVQKTVANVKVQAYNNHGCLP